MGLVPIDAYVFDCGRVITFDQEGAAVARLASLLGADPETFGRIYAQERVDDDRGTLSAAEYRERVGLRFGATGADPARCLLIDDTRVNVEAARAAGMHAVHFTPADSLAAALARDFTPGDGHS